ncbi:hypothetical protein AAC387_Pa05g2276 [Persea americana]
MGIGTKRANIYFDVITAYEFDSLMAQGELYHDTATKVSGRASQGRVRGLGIVSKTAIKTFGDEILKFEVELLGG